MSGRFDEARQHIEESRALARDLGLIWQAGVQELLSGYVELLASDPVAAERDMRAAEEVFREIGEGWFLSTVAVDLPRAVYEQGRYDDAFALLGAIDEQPRRPIASGRSSARGSPRVPARQTGTCRGGREPRPRGGRAGRGQRVRRLACGRIAGPGRGTAAVRPLGGSRAATAVEAVRLYERKGNVAGMARAGSLVGSF